MEIFQTLYTKTCAYDTVTCELHPENCAIGTGFCVPYTENYLRDFGKTLNFHLEPRTKILAHFKGLECKIAF